jgi:NADH-quinone oxidoreductase subunit D
MPGPEVARMPEELTIDSPDYMLLNMGPQHPSTHGVIRFVLETDGEVVRKATPVVGYLHRGMEKIATEMTYSQFMPISDRLDYVASMCGNLAWCEAVERMAGIEAPRRAQFLRVIAVELNRISSHLVSVGSFCNDVGGVTPLVVALREREAINDILEMLSGARLTYNYMRLGGVSRDMSGACRKLTAEFLDHFPPALDEFNRLITYNKIFIKRLGGIGIITPQDARAYGLNGPNIRGSGIRFDLRRNDPYSVYPELDFEIPVGQGFAGHLGDCYDRYMVRINEMYESVKIVRQCLEMMPDGELTAKVARVLKIKAGEHYTRTESARGEMGIYIVSRGDKTPYRVRVRTSSYSALSIFEKLSPGMMIADLVALIGSFDIVAPEIDR